MSDFVFNGISASSMGLHIERYPAIPKPRRRMETISVPGRSGDLHIDDGSWEDITIRYDCWFKATPDLDDLTYLAHIIAEWLHTAPASSRLEETYNPEHFWLATFVGPMNIENIFGRYGRCAIEFRCSPCAYLVAGTRRVDYTSKDVVVPIVNPTKYAAKPLVEVTTNGKMGGTIRIDSYELQLLFGQLTQPLRIYIDCDILEAWYIEDGQEISCNSVVDSPDWPVIEPGLHYVSWAGLGIDSVSITPRWWRL